MITTLNNSQDTDAQLEVWEWKHILYDEIKDLDKYARFEYIVNKAFAIKKNLIERKEKENQLTSV